MEYVAFITIILACIVLPVIIFVVLMIKEKDSRIGQMIFFLSGVAVYFVMQWGLKEKGMQWLYNHKTVTGIDMNQFSSDHYLFSLFLIALIGALFLFGMSFVLFRFVFKRNYTFKNIIFYGLGYCMTEAVMLAGLRSIDTIVLRVQGIEGELSASIMELFLSAYERVLIMIIESALLLVLAYFIQKCHSVMGTVLTIFCGTLVGFLPAFFLAFSTSEFLDIYSRNVALIIIYVFLSAAGLTGTVLLWNFRYSFADKNCIKKKTKIKEKCSKE